MSSVRLVYFDCRGRADPIRMLLEMAKVTYSFEPVNLATWKTEGKAKVAEITPFGQLPIYEELDEHGKVQFRLTQSLAIARHIAHKHGLCGNTEQERARADEWLDTAVEVHMEVGLMTWNPKWEEERPQLRAKQATRLDALERWFVSHRADPHHTVSATKFTIGDVYLAYMLELTLTLHPDLLTEKSYPNLYAFMMHFYTSPGPVRDYVFSSRRPVTYTIPIAPFAGKAAEMHQFKP